jgi:hypothetical protein
MRQSFWKVTLISFAAYAGALLLGVYVDFRYTFIAVAALQATWT